jgi:hypothetical protein
MHAHAHPAHPLSYRTIQSKRSRGGGCYYTSQVREPTSADGRTPFHLFKELAALRALSVKSSSCYTCITTATRTRAPVQSVLLHAAQGQHCLSNTYRLGG